MNELAKPAATVAAVLERMHVRVWADKSLRECVAIAGRSSKRGGRTTVDVARLDAVLGLLIQSLEAERRTLAERGGLPA